MKIELVSISLPVNFGHYVFVVVVAQSATQFVVVHIRFALSLSPTPCHLVWVNQFEFAVGSLPSNTGSVGAVRQELEKELPQLYLTAPFLHP